MRQDTSQGDPAVALASAPASSATGQPEALLPALPRLGRRLELPRLRQVAISAAAGRAALAAIFAGTFALVAFASANESVLVPRSYLTFPHWEAGPLHFAFHWLTNDATALNVGLSALAIAMTVAYAGVLFAIRTLSMRTLVIAIVALHAVLLMGPPLQLTDLFNYLGYARLGAVHHLNPYTHGIASELHDPVYRFASWHHLHSPYGPLFTAISYPLGLLPMPVAYWTLKLLSVIGSLGFISLVWKCARVVGRDPRFAVAFVALNPIYLIYAVGGFHNDFFMLIPSLGAITLLLARRDRTAGAVLMFAVAVKFTAILLLPFLLIAARPPERRLRLLGGAFLSAIPLAALSIAMFGFTIPNLADQSTLLTDLSVPNLVGLVLGVGGGTPGVLRAANVALVLVVLYCLRRRSDWLSNAGWATLALLASLAWLVPWYILWVLPLAALGTSVRLRRAAVAFTVFLVLSFVPVTGILLIDHGLNPMGSAVGQASKALQRRLSG
jgi:Glycosyltransferase family 87